MAPLYVLTGTGTSVGKTYVAERLLRAFAYVGEPALGYKPLESGVSEGADTDIARLRRSSTFHVKPELRSDTFATPVSPHLAARLESRTVDLDTIRSEVRRACVAPVGCVLLELPGGAFSPMTDEFCCAQFARSLPEAKVILVALNRLGVLHDVAATSRACAAMGLPLFGLVLNDAEATDASSSSNAGELHRVSSLPLLAHLPRTDTEVPIRESDPAFALARVLATHDPKWRPMRRLRT